MTLNTYSSMNMKQLCRVHRLPTIETHFTLSDGFQATCKIICFNSTLNKQNID